LPTSEQTIYKCTLEKHEFLRSKPHIYIDYPCALLMVVEEARRIENCKLLNWISESDESLVYAVSKRVSFLLFIIVDSMTFFMIFLTTNHVSLKSRSGFMFLNTIIGEPIFIGTQI